MDIKRIVLYAALAFVTWSLINAWQADYPASTPTTVSSSNALTPEGHLLPKIPASEQNLATDTTLPVAEAKPEAVAGQVIQIKTDVLNIAVDLTQGDIVGSQLLHYPESVDNKDKPFTLLNDGKDSRYVANSSLVVLSNGSLQSINPAFHTEKDKFVLQPDQDTLQVVLKGTDKDGLVINKIYTFTRGSYVIKTTYEIVNNSSEAWKGYLNTQLLRKAPEEDSSSIFHIGSFTGASWSNPGKQNYKKISFSQMEKHNLEESVKGGWVAMQQHYFLSAWIPDPNSTNTLYTRVSQDTFTIGAVSQPIQVEPGSKTEISSRLFTGPEITDMLAAIAPALDQTVDYGWLWFLSSLLFSVMKAIYGVVGNWGWSIILVTLLIKLAFYRLSATSYRSMAGMRKIQPKLQALRERYGNDKVQMSQATMELYRQEKLNPLGGCLPILIQIPVFIALYWVLLESVELRQAPFMLWIQDLAAADPYHVLPIIMGATMLIQQKLNPAPPDPIQAKVMMFLPLLFTALFWSFPAGLVLYWVVNNTLSILQQWYITRKYEATSNGNNANGNKKTGLMTK